MGSITDPVWVNVTSHSKCYDGTTRNDYFSWTTTLANYKADVANNMATPLYNQIAAERIDSGSPATPINNYGPTLVGGTGASYACDLRFEIAVGYQALATPARYHLVRQAMLSDAAVVGAGDIYTWITAHINQLSPVDIYPGSVNLI